MSRYDLYNREERAICAHLFRLLHERLGEGGESPLGRFIGVLSRSKLDVRGRDLDLGALRYGRVEIFCEASLIRDAFFSRKPEVNPFMDELSRLIMRQEGVAEARLYSELPATLKDVRKTHPKQIQQKAMETNIELSKPEQVVYGAMQGMFNAKPDLVIVVDDLLLVCEAKHTESFDEEQLRRTWKIAEVWATLLYADLGFEAPPAYAVFKLGGRSFAPHVSWSDVCEIAEKTYHENDRTRIAIKAGTELLKRLNLE